MTPKFILLLLLSICASPVFSAFGGYHQLDVLFILKFDMYKPELHFFIFNNFLFVISLLLPVTKFIILLHNHFCLSTFKTQLALNNAEVTVVNPHTVENLSVASQSVSTVLHLGESTNWGSCSTVVRIY